MKSITSLPTILQNLLTTEADHAGVASGFVRRRRKLTGSSFVQTLVVGWLNRPAASLDNLTQTAALLPVAIRPQSLDERFTPQSAACLQRVLEAAVRHVIGAEPVAIPLLRRFKGVFIDDSSTVVLPDALARIWRGNGGNSATHTQAALKLVVRFDLAQGALEGPFLQDGRAHDRASVPQKRPIPRGGLRLADTAFVALGALRTLDERGAFYLSRLPRTIALFTTDGKRLDVLAHLQAAPDQVDLPVLLGVTQRLPARLIAVRVPEKVAQQRRERLREAARVRQERASEEALALCAWTLLITNLHADQLSVAEALVLLRIRWQIERLFCLWKDHGLLDAWRTANPWRILTEVYAKLLALLIGHWLVLQGSWDLPNRSLVKAAQTVEDLAPLVALALAGRLPGLDLRLALDVLAEVLACGCRMNRRKTKPNAYQLLLDPALLGYP